MAETSFRKSVKRQVSGAVARLWRRPRLSAEEIRATRPARILIVRQHNQMGDMVCATPCFRAVREAWPEAEIGLVCAPVNREVVAHNPHLDRIFLFDKKACTRPGPLWSFVRELRDFGPDLALVLTSVSYSITSAALAAVSGARLLVGGDSRPFGFDVSRHAYSLELPSSLEVVGHAVDHNLASLEAAGISPSDRATVVVPSAAERERAAEIAAGVPGDGPLWIMHPGAGKTMNLWPADGFATVAAAIIEAGRPLLVLQGPADGAVVAAFCNALARRAPDADDRWLLLPPVTVGVCAALLESADRFLCNDTGLMHVAGAVGVPTLALFGPTDPDVWAPRHPLLRILRADSTALTDLDADRVSAAFRDLPGRGTWKGPPP